MAARHIVSTLLATACGALLLVPTRLAGHCLPSRTVGISTSRQGVEFPLPPGWTIGNTIRTTDGGEQVSLLDAASPFTWVAVWMTPVVNTPAEVNAAIELVMPAKLDQRLGLFAGYQFRPEKHSAPVHR